MKRMKLKANIFTLITTGCLSATIFISCVSQPQKQDDAFDRIKKVRMLSNDSNFVSKEVINESMKTEPVKKIEKQDEWTKFKNEIENRVHLNEKKISEIRSLPDVNDRLNKKLKSLERDNNDLMIEIDKYNEEVKVKWETFKVSMSHNVNEIDIELNAIKTGNSK